MHASELCQMGGKGGQLQCCTMLLVPLPPLPSPPLPFPPLPLPATLKLLVQLDGGEEGLAMIAEARRKAKGGKSPVMSCVDLKDDRSFPIPRTCSAGSLPIHSIGSTPLQTPQGTPAVPRRETFAGTSPKSPHKSSLSSSAPEADTATGKKTNSLPTDTPPSTKSEFAVVTLTTYWSAYTVTLL